MSSNNEEPDDGSPICPPASSVNVASAEDPNNYSVGTDPNVERLFVNGKHRWKCKFCNMTFAWNATKILKHFAGISHGDIKLCAIIPKIQKMKYEKIYFTREQSADRHKQQLTRQREISAATNNEMALAFENHQHQQKRIKSSAVVATPSPKSYTQLRVTAP